MGIIDQCQFDDYWISCIVLANLFLTFYMIMPNRTLKVGGDESRDGSDPEAERDGVMLRVESFERIGGAQIPAGVTQMQLARMEENLRRVLEDDLPDPVTGLNLSDTLKTNPGELFRLADERERSLATHGTPACYRMTVNGSEYIFNGLALFKVGDTDALVPRDVVLIFLDKVQETQSDAETLLVRSALGFTPQTRAAMVSLIRKSR